MKSDSQARVYRGSTVDELLPRIQRELGSDAIIVRRREGLTGGILGFFQRSFVEIEAVPGGPRIDVYDEDQDEIASLRSSPASLEQRPASSSQTGRTPDVAQLGGPPPSTPRPALARSQVGGSAPPAARGVYPTTQGAYVTEQLAALAMAGPAKPIVHGARPVPERTTEQTRKSNRPSSPSHAPTSRHALDSFASALASAEAMSVPPPSRPQPEPWSVPAAPAPNRRAGVSIERRLIGVGMSESFARELIETARAHVLPLAPGAGLTRAVRVALAQRIPVAPPLPIAGAAIVVVGAGGSGKTSCCAALMRAYRRVGTLPAGYASLTWEVDRPGLHMLLSPHLMRPTPIDAQRSRRALRRVRGEGLLVIDTPRLSPAVKADVHELAGMLGELAAQRIVVALPATLGATAAAQLLEALRPLGANALSVTHADETDQIGIAVEAACSFGLAPEYRLDRNRSGAWRIGRMDPASLAELLLP